MTYSNKRLLHKALIILIWAYGIEVCNSKNTNGTIFQDLDIPTVQDYIKKRKQQIPIRVEHHPNSVTQVINRNQRQD